MTKSVRAKSLALQPPTPRTRAVKAVSAEQAPPPRSMPKTVPRSGPANVRPLGVEVTINGEDLTIVTSSRVRGGSRGPRPQPDPPTPGEAASLGIAARFLSAAAAIQAEEADAQRPALLRAMMVSGLDPVPRQTIDQSRRLARQRERLLASGAFTMEALREVRGDSAASATRTWVARRRAAHELFTVTYDGAALAPAFQFDNDGHTRPAVVSVLKVLTPLKLGSWATWTWFTAAGTWLDGRRPADLLDTEPGRVLQAARRFASNAAA